MVLVDSSAWIEMLREAGDVVVRRRVEALLAAGRAAWCPVIRLELWHGARGAAEKRMLASFEQRLPEFEILPEVWELACELSRQARAQGHTVPVADLIIAACARHHGLEIEHNDAHFDFLMTL